MQNSYTDKPQPLFRFICDIGQHDYMEAEFLESFADMLFARKNAVDSFVGGTVLCGIIAAAVGFFVMRGVIVWQSLMLVGIAYACVLANFLYNYFIGYKEDYGRTLAHFMKSDAEGLVFFKPEQATFEFFEQEFTFMSQEQRRYAAYGDIQHIDETRRCYIFTMKYDRKKVNLRGFRFAVLPKLYISAQKAQPFAQHIAAMRTKYGLKQLAASSPLAIAAQAAQDEQNENDGDGDSGGEA